MKHHPNILDINDSLLLVIDMQTRLLDVMPEQERHDMLNHGLSLVKAAKLLNIPIMVTEQYTKGLGLTDGALSEELPENTLIFEKTSFSCFDADGFTQAVTQSARKQIIIIGQETHICVLQTALDLIHKDYQVYIVEDASCSRSSQHKSSALQRMQQHGASICSYESVLFEWLKNSTHPEFKTISKLVR